MSLTMRFGTITGPSVSIAREAFPPCLAFERILTRCACLAGCLPAADGRDLGIGGDQGARQMVPRVLGSVERCGRLDDTLSAMRFFNTEGPVVARKHYCIPLLERVNVAELLALIAQERYFVLHAPRQTGKTSVLLALRDLLEAGGAGDYRCVYVNVEAAQAVREDVECAMRVILGEMGDSALFQGDGFLDGIWSDILEKFGDGALGAALTRWCQADPKPLVLLIDEIDTLIGDTLIAVLRQLRAGYVRRPGGFPQSGVLCGVRGYRIHSSTEQAVVTGGSAFNIRTESLRLGDFTEAEVRALVAQRPHNRGADRRPHRIRHLLGLSHGPHAQARAGGVVSARRPGRPSALPHNARAARQP